MNRTSNVFAGSLVCLAGCYQRVVEDDRLTVTYSLWFTSSVALVGAAFFLFGVAAALRGTKWWLLLALLGLAMGGFLAPTMYLDHADVDRNGFSSRHGFMWSPIVHDIRFDELSHVRGVVKTYVDPDNGSKSNTYYLDCTFRSGREERVPVGEVVRPAMPEIREGFRRHGVPLEAPPNFP